jgi:hypothetical protein
MELDFKQFSALAMNDSSVLVLRTEQYPDRDSRDHLVRRIRELMPDWDGVLIFLIADDTIEALSPVDMAREGWFRRRADPEFVAQHLHAE